MIGERIRIQVVEKELALSGDTIIRCLGLERGHMNGYESCMPESTEEFRTQDGSVEAGGGVGVGVAVGLVEELR